MCTSVVLLLSATSAVPPHMLGWFILYAIERCVSDVKQASPNHESGNGLGLCGLLLRKHG